MPHAKPPSSPATSGTPFQVAAAGTARSRAACSSDCMPPACTPTRASPSLSDSLRGSDLSSPRLRPPRSRSSACPPSPLPSTSAAMPPPLLKPSLLAGPTREASSALCDAKCPPWANSRLADCTPSPVLGGLPSPISTHSRSPLPCPPACPCPPPNRPTPSPHLSQPATAHVQALARQSVPSSPLRLHLNSSQLPLRSHLQQPRPAGRTTSCIGGCAAVQPAHARASGAAPGCTRNTCYTGSTGCLQSRQCASTFRRCASCHGS